MPNTRPDYIPIIPIPVGVLGAGVTCELDRGEEEGTTALELWSGKSVIVATVEMILFVVLVGSLLGAASGQDLQTARHVTTRESGQVVPAQPQDFVIFISNFCNGTATLSKHDEHLWEGTYAVAPQDTVASQSSRAYKYGFEVKADASSQRINGTVLYTNPTVYIDFFSVPHEWGVSVSYSKTAAVHTMQADVGSLSVYNIVVGEGQTC
jgi:hypothetical protein